MSQQDKHINNINGWLLSTLMSHKHWQWSRFQGPGTVPWNLDHCHRSGGHLNGTEPSLMSLILLMTSQNVCSEKGLFNLSGGLRLAENTFVKHQVMASFTSSCRKSFTLKAFQSMGPAVSPAQIQQNKPNSPAVHSRLPRCMRVFVSRTTSSWNLKVHYMDPLPPPACFTFRTQSWECQNNCVKHKLQLSWL